jgi:hypothetical protein
VYVMGRFWRALAIFEVAVLLFVAMLSYIVVEGQAITRFAYEFNVFKPLAVYATDRYIIMAGGNGGPAVVAVNRTSGALVKSWYYSENDPNSCDIAFDGSYVYVGCIRSGRYVFLGKYSYPDLNAVWERILTGFAYSVIDIDANNGNLYFVIRGYGGGSDFVAGYYSSDGGGFVVRSVSLPSDYTDVTIVSGVIGTGYYDQIGLCGFAKFTYSGTTYNTLFYLEMALASGNVYKNVMVQVPSIPSNGYNLVEAWLNGSKVIFNVGRYVAVFNRDTNVFESVRSISVSGVSYYYDSDIEIYGSNLYMAIRYYNTTSTSYMIGVVKFNTGFNVLDGYGYSGTYNNFYDFATYSDNIAVVNAAGSYYMFYAPLGIGIPYKVTASGISASFTTVSTTSYSISYSFGTPSVSASTISSSALSLSTGYLYLDVVTTVTSTVTNTVTSTSISTVTNTVTTTTTNTVTNTVTSTSISTVTNTVTSTSTVVNAVPYPYTVTETVTTTVTAGPSVDIYVVVFVVAALIAVAVVYSYRRR